MVSHEMGVYAVSCRTNAGAYLVTDPFLILGIEPSATEMAIDDAFSYLNRHLNPTNFPVGSPSESQANQCMSKIVPSYQMLRDAATRNKMRLESMAEREKPFNPEDLKPFLGHICVAAGIITLDDLNDAILKQGDIDLPLGQILQEQALLSQTELDGLLMGQRLFGAPNRPLDALTKRLLALSAVSRDMVKIVLIDQRTNFVSDIPDLLKKRGWLSEEIMQIVQDQTATHSAGN